MASVKLFLPCEVVVVDVDVGESEEMLIAPNKGTSGMFKASARKAAKSR